MRTLQKIFFILVLGFIFVVPAHHASAATRTVTAAGGNYDNPGTWTQGTVPVNGDDIIANGSSGPLVINVNPSVANTINFTGYTNTVTLQYDWSVTGTFTTGGTLNGKTLYVGGSLVKSAILKGTTLIYMNGSATGRTISGSGVVESDLTISPTGGDITISGSFTKSGPSGNKLTYIPAGGIVNASGSTLGFSGDTRTAAAASLGFIVDTNSLVWAGININGNDVGNVLSTKVTLLSDLRTSGLFQWGFYGSTHRPFTLNGPGALHCRSMELKGAGDTAMTGTASIIFDGTTPGTFTWSSSVSTFNNNIVFNSTAPVTVQADNIAVSPTQPLYKTPTLSGNITYVPGSVAPIISNTTIYLGNGTSSNYNYSHPYNTLDLPGLTINNLTVADSRTITLASNLAISGTLTINGVTTFTESSPGSGVINFGSNSKLTGAGALAFQVDFSLTPGMSLTHTGTLTFSSASGTKTVTTNGFTIPEAVTFSGNSGTWQLQDTFESTAAVGMKLTSGTLNTNGKTVRTKALSVSGGTLATSTSVIELTSTGTVWNVTGGAINGTSGTIKITDSSVSTPITFAGGSKTGYGTVWFMRGTSGAPITITGSNTFVDFKDTGSIAHTIFFTAGTTQTVSAFSVSGADSNNRITLTSTTTAPFYLVKIGGCTNSRDYLNIQHSIATPSTYTWYAGTHSINNQAVVSAGSGWIFEAGPPEAVTTATTGMITGIAWGADDLGGLGGIGEIFFSPQGGSSDAYLFISSDGSIYGKAWSPNYGWIRFDAGCPSGASGYCNAEFTNVSDPSETDLLNKTDLVGWARVCSVYASSDACAGGLKDNIYLGGWDGWISLSSYNSIIGNGSYSYGITRASDGKLTGYAWGSDVVGWINFGPFSNSAIATISTEQTVSAGYCPIDVILTATPDATCQASGNSFDVSWSVPSNTNSMSANLNVDICIPSIVCTNADGTDAECTNTGWTTNKTPSVTTLTTPVNISITSPTTQEVTATLSLACSNTLSGETETATTSVAISQSCILESSCGNGTPTNAPYGTPETLNAEQCDMGVQNGVIPTGLSYGQKQSYCSSSCKIETAGSWCGDSIIQGSEGEECDNGNLNGTYNNSCSTTCKTVTPSSCGDGITQSYEACDASDQSSNNPYKNKTTCTPTIDNTPCSYCVAQNLYGECTIAWNNYGQETFSATIEQPRPVCIISGDGQIPTISWSSSPTATNCYAEVRDSGDSIVNNWSITNGVNMSIFPAEFDNKSGVGHTLIPESTYTISLHCDNTNTNPTQSIDATAVQLTVKPIGSFCPNIQKYQPIHIES